MQPTRHPDPALSQLNSPYRPLMQVGSLSPASRLNGSLVDVTGGDPAQLTSNIYLCSRSDSDPDRRVIAGLPVLPRNLH